MLAIGAGASLAKKAEPWVEVRSPNFLVLTNANEKQGRRVAYQFEMIRAVFRQFFNLQGSATDQPVIIIAGRDEETLKALLPEYWAKKGSAHPAGFYLGSTEKNYVALRLDVTMNQEAYEPFEPVYHEYVHYLTRRMMSQLPLWMVEGLAEFYGNTRLEGKQIFVGAPSASNIMVLRQEQPLPLSTLFAVNASSPYYHEENKASIFYAESWALTHYLITRDWREKTHRLSDFLTLLGQSVPAEEAARRTIGDVKALEMELMLYIGHFAFTVARQSAPPGVDPDSFQATAASDAESLARRADFMARDRHGQEAEEMLKEALKLEPNLAIAHESMGFLLSQQGKFAEAAKWYSQAVALNSQSCLANYYYAVSLLKGYMDDHTAAQAEASLRAAIKVAPDFAPAYSALGWLMASRHQDLGEAYRMTLMAVSLEPGDFHHRINSAQVLEMVGRVNDAITVAKVAATMAKTPGEQAEAQAFISNAQQHKEFLERAKEQEEAFKKAQANATASSHPGQDIPTGTLSQEGSAPGQESAQPPVLRHRDEALGGNTANASPGDALSPHAPRPELLPARQVAEGTIKDAKCPGGTTLEFTLDSRNGVLHLYSDHYLKIPYNALNFTPQGILNPCTDIQGLHARVAYHSAKGQPNQGEVVEIGLMRN
jgi:tetratricopeptide (TPR) repeat protein